MKIQDVLLAFAVIFIWGSYFIVSKIGIAEIPPIFMSSIRLLFPALLIAPFFRPKKANIKGIILLSFGMAAEVVLTFTGLEKASGSNATIIFQFAVPLSAVLAAFFFKEKMNMTKWAGVIIALSGILLIAGAPEVSNVFPLLLITGASTAWALSNIIIKKMAEVSPFTLVGWGAVFAFPQLLTISLIFEEKQFSALANASIPAIGAVFYAGLISFIIAQVIWYYLIKKYTVNRITPFIFFEPIVGLFCGYWLLHEQITIHKLLGCILVIIGMVIIEFFADINKIDINKNQISL